MPQVILKYITSFIELYHCTAFLVYSRMLLVFFWELRSLFLRFSLPDILGFFSYQLLFSLVESVSVTVLVVVLLSLMPFRPVREHLPVVGALAVSSYVIGSLIFKERSGLILWLHTSLSVALSSASQIIAFFSIFAFCGLPIVAILILRNEKQVVAIKTFLENLSVLAGLYTILGVIGLLVVIYRNLP